ncbi:hypothetical protein [Kribbella sp. NPDC051770]|uniref:hypothetical protein n=1 Tax=Kribbella sp. NPDC051770 TaxID=3155413 RepID=UPI003437D634
MLIGNLIWGVGLVAVLLGLVATMRYRVLVGALLIVAGLAVGVAGSEVVAG